MFNPLSTYSVLDHRLEKIFVLHWYWNVCTTDQFVLGNFRFDGCLNCLTHDHIYVMKLDLKKCLGYAQNTMNV